MDIWNDDAIQFPRLLAEIAAVITLGDEEWNTLAESMDLTRDDVQSLFDRAQERWEYIKYGTLTMEENN